MDFEQMKNRADEEIIKTIYEYLEKGYVYDLERETENSLYLTKLTNIDINRLKAKFNRVCISKNSIFTEKNFLEEQKYAYTDKHKITPYLISTATLEEPFENILPNGNKDWSKPLGLTNTEISLIYNHPSVEFLISNKNYEKGE